MLRQLKRTTEVIHRDDMQLSSYFLKRYWAMNTLHIILFIFHCQCFQIYPKRHRSLELKDYWISFSSRLKTDREPQSQFNIKGLWWWSHCLKIILSKPAFLITGKSSIKNFPRSWSASHNWVWGHSPCIQYGKKGW